jgi:hypothetical protein
MRTIVVLTTAMAVSLCGNAGCVAEKDRMDPKDHDRIRAGAAIPVPEGSPAREAQPPVIGNGRTKCSAPLIR